MRNSSFPRAYSLQTFNSPFELVKCRLAKFIKKLKITANKNIINFFSLLLLFFSFSHSIASSPQEINFLLNQGQGINAKNEAIKLLNSSKDKQEKIYNTRLLLDICMFVSDIDCFAKFWDENWELLNNELVLMRNGTVDEKNKWSMETDHWIAHYLFRINMFPSEDLVKAISYSKNKVNGDVRYEYAGLRTVLEAKAAAAIDDRVLARKLLRRARSLVLSRNLNNLTEQLTLAYCLETSAYQLFETQEVRRFLNSFVQATKDTGVQIDTYINPYIAVRLYRVILESRILNSKDQAAVIDYLHHLYQGLQLAPNSTLVSEKESFYAHLALDKSWGNDLATNFDPVAEIQKIEDPINVTAIGVRAYLQAINPSKGDDSFKQLEKAFKWYEQIQKNNDSASSKNYKPTYLILKSLDSRIRGKLDQEKKYLEEWIESQLDYFKFGGFTLLDQPPSLNSLNVKIIRYTIQRLIELEPDSKALLRLAYFSVVTFNAMRDGDASTSYSLLNASKSDLKNQQIQDRIKLNANYSRKIVDSYYKSARHMISSRDTKTYDGGVDLLDSYHLLEKLNFSDEQLSEFLTTSSPHVNLDYKDLIPLKSNSSVVLFSEADGYILILILRQNKSSIQLIPLSGDEIFSDALSILTSKNLDTIPADKIKKASVYFSKKLFGESYKLGEHIEILSGPTILNVPYTLLSDPLTGNWLIEHTYIESYLSPQQRNITIKKPFITRHTDFVAFANPVLRSKDEEKYVGIVSGMIRGTSDSFNSLPELPETEIEALNLSKAFNGKKYFYFGKEANLQNLVAMNFDNVNVLSFSTHGVLAGEVEGVKSSSIVFSPTKGNNGLISADWLFSLNGSPNLVILSTCNSGTSLQPLDRTELTSLASVFLLKGSSAVISSYWQVDSQATTEMMTRFSEEIKNSDNYSTALLRSIRSMQSDPKWQHPSVWAAFVMIGNYAGNLKIAKFEKEINLNINGSVRHSYRKNDSTVLIGFENISEDEWAMTENRITQNEKNSDVILIKEKVYPPFNNVEISEANVFGPVAAIQNGDSWIFSYINPSGDFNKVCNLENVAKDWLIGDFFRTKEHIFSLFKRPADEGVEYGLVSISVKDCKANVKAPFLFKSGIKGFANLRLFPLSSGEEVVFATSLPTKGKNDTFTGQTSELGIAPSCKYYTFNNYHIIGSDLVEKRQTTYENILIDNIQNAGTPIGVVGLEEDACNGKVNIRFLSDKFFNSPDISDQDKAQISKDAISIEISEISNKNFELIRHIWWKPGEEYFFVVGIPIFPSTFLERITEETVGSNSYNEWLSGLSSVYSFNLVTKKWSKLATSEQCDFPQPLGYSKGSFFLCNDMTTHSNKRNTFLKRIQ